MDFWGTFGAGIALLAVSGVAYASWNDPKLYTRLFWLPAGLLFIAAMALGSMSTVYGWGWNDAIDAVRVGHPEFSLGIPLRTGERQSTIVFAMLTGVIYMVIMGFVAKARADAGKTSHPDNKPEP